MRSIFIGSTGGEPGQTLTTWALALRLKEKGLRVGFFKPYGLLPHRSTSPQGLACDSDVLLLKAVLGVTEKDEVLCPIIFLENHDPERKEDREEPPMEKIQRAFREVSLDKDVVLVMGGKEIFFGEGGPSGLSDSQLVKWFDASVLLVDRYQRDNMTFYSLLSLNSFLDGRVKSALLNHVAPEKMDHVRTKVIPFLKDKGIKSVVAVPEDPVLAAFSVSTIADSVEGQILCCPESAGNLVQTSTIGSTYLKGSLSIFKQVYNKVILVGPGGEGVEEKGVAGIIVTGGKNPSEIVLKAARDGSIPLILTRADTFQVMERLEKYKPALTMKEEFKVRKLLDLIDREMGADRWVEELLQK